MERRNHAGIATFLWSESTAPGAVVTLGGSVLQHARVRRVRQGDALQLLDGVGAIAHGVVQDIGKDELVIAVKSVGHAPRPTPLDVLVPVADRDRMLWAAEKCVELGITSWRPVRCARSASVSPRGEGARFAEKVSARMRSALEQSVSAWMPDVHEEREFRDALGDVPSAWARVILDRRGEPLAGLVGNEPTAFVVGPEGGLVDEEIEAARAAGWVLAALGPATLRFETAIITAAAVTRAVQLSSRVDT